LTKIKSWRDRHIAKKTVDVEPQVFRRGISAIFPSYGYSPIKMAGSDIGFIEAENTIRKNESPFVGNKSVTGQFGLRLGSYPQRESERGNDDSGNRSNGRTIVIYEVARASDVTIDRGTESGWTFFGGLPPSLVC
jgi:hypothetical protein